MNFPIGNIQAWDLGKPVRPRGSGGWLPGNQKLVEWIPSFTIETGKTVGTDQNNVFKPRHPIKSLRTIKILA
jgi:hypothetical protein